ncbi:MAG TPA: methyltransferase domain-containing protein [Candidatus Cybelea sp.]|jgi:SAM-dependent methyltransferase
MPEDLFSAFKDRQREMWASFPPTATFTTPPAAHLVRFAGISPGEAVLDIGAGTGVVAITAANAGARVSALDLTPALLEAARENARIAGFPEIDWVEGDAERLPYPDASFNVVLSQFGHMFAPQPDVAMAEMRRVLKPGGRIAFATWPPDRLVGQFFALIGRNSPPLPPGVVPPVLWGDESVVRERLAKSFDEPVCERGVMAVPALSLAHYRLFMERSVGPMERLVASLAGDPERLAALRREYEEISAPYYANNIISQEYLLTKAAAKA